MTKIFLKIEIDPDKIQMEGFIHSVRQFCTGFTGCENFEVLKVSVDPRRIYSRECSGCGTNESIKIYKGKKVNRWHRGKNNDGTFNKNYYCDHCYFKTIYEQSKERSKILNTFPFEEVIK